MNSALSIISPEEQSARSATAAQHGTGIHLVSGTESSVAENISSSAAPAGVQSGQQAKPVTKPDQSTLVAAPKAQSAPLSDIEHFASQLDVDKVLLIPAGVTIDGNISTKGLASVVISGKVNGDIEAGSGSVIVREGGSVEGTVKSDEMVIVAGSITNTKQDGLAIATGGLWILSETGVVRGDVAYARHRVYEGAVFGGRAIPFSEYKG